jgi:hypothetical protein
MTGKKQHRLVRRNAPELIALNDLGVPAGHQQLLLSLGELQLQFVRGSYARRCRSAGLEVDLHGTDRVVAFFTRHCDGTLRMPNISKKSVPPGDRTWHQVHPGYLDIPAYLAEAEKTISIQIKIESC